MTPPPPQSFSKSEFLCFCVYEPLLSDTPGADLSSFCLRNKNKILRKNKSEYYEIISSLVDALSELQQKEQELQQILHWLLRLIHKHQMDRVTVLWLSDILTVLFLQNIENSCSKYCDLFLEILQIFPRNTATFFFLILGFFFLKY